MNDIEGPLRALMRAEADRYNPHDDFDTHVRRHRARVRQRARRQRIGTIVSVVTIILVALSLYSSQRRSGSQFATTGGPAGSSAPSQTSCPTADHIPSLAQYLSSRQWSWMTAQSLTVLPIADASVPASVRQQAVAGNLSNFAMFSGAQSLRGPTSDSALTSNQQARGVSGLIASSWIVSVSSDGVAEFIGVGADGNVTFADPCNGPFANTLAGFAATHPNSLTRPVDVLRELIAPGGPLLDQLRSFEAATIAPPTTADWSSRDPGRRQFDRLQTPPSLLASLPQVGVEIHIPDEWRSSSALSICGRTSLAWDDCVLLSAFPQNGVGTMFWYQVKGEPIEIWISPSTRIYDGGRLIGTIPTEVAAVNGAIVTIMGNRSPVVDGQGLRVEVTPAPQLAPRANVPHS